ncbi:MAG: ATP-dependent 6-phosphofructokinase [Chloroflexi bacterium]|nr:ATP-dependent 6-phosphofructokinase [Chloroflexota bacterium]
MKKSRIGLLTGGGDCAGLNPAIKWVVNSALDERFPQEAGMACEILGIKDGWKGLVQSLPDSPDYIMELSADHDLINACDRHGGTILGTSRTNPYSSKNDQSKKVLENIEKLGLDVVIAIGGEDTLGVAAKLSRDGVNVIGIPKTIDKDLVGTDYTLGYETALNVITEEIDRLRTTAGSHRRTFVVETMGRNAGWLALEGGESAGASIILIPEYDFSIQKINELLLKGRKRGATYDIVVVSEGAKPEKSAQLNKMENVDSFGHKILGGIGEYLAREIQEGTKLETRSIVLSHLQRGGPPCAFDRRMGRYFGIAAVDLLAKRDFGKMVSYLKGQITAVPISEVLGKLNLVNVKTQYDTEKYNGRRTIILK